MNENYKNYGKIIQSDFINLPYKSHKWDKGRDAKLVHPGVLNLKRICTTKWLGYMAYHRENCTYYFTDRNEALIKFVNEDLNLKIVETEVDNNIIVHSVVGRNPGKLLKRPVSICINSLGHIFIGDHGGDGQGPSLIIYDEHLTKISVIQNEHIVTPSCMEIEEVDDDQFRLYITDWMRSSLTVWNVTFDRQTNKYNFEYFKKLNVIAPSIVRVDKRHVVVVSEVSWNWKNDENKEITEALPSDVEYFKREIRNVTSGLNAIIIYDKESFEIFKIIELIDHLNPRGLFIDKEGRIYTTAYQLTSKLESGYRPDMSGLIEQYFAITEENAHTNVQTDRVTLLSTYNSQRFNDRRFSEDMWLIVMNKNGDILQETNLGIEFIGDFLVFEAINKNKILFMSQRNEPALYQMEFMEIREN